MPPGLLAMKIQKASLAIMCAYNCPNILMQELKFIFLNIYKELNYTN